MTCRWRSSAFDRATLPALVLAFAMACGGAATSAAAPRMVDPDRAAELTSGTVAQLAAWVVTSGDGRRLPFLIVDKVHAEAFVFAADGRLWGAAPVLVGQARGDDSTPGVGDRELSAIPPPDRTTPAGRFLAALGPAAGGHQVLWVDYGAAISLHPVVTANRKEQREKRLRSPSPEDNRITYGCINVPAGFYEGVVRPAFTGIRGAVYILPDSKSLEAVFPTFAAEQASAAPPADVGVTEEAGSAGVDAAALSNGRTAPQP